jgi:DNA-binding NtrC family response regulator
MARILIVEDDRPFADALACVLGLEGYEVLTANSAEEGVQLGLKNSPDVIIADWMLKSEMHGGDVCKRINYVCPDAKTIMMTGHQEYLSLATRNCTDVEAVIAKPFHKKQILDAVRSALSAEQASDMGTFSMQ